ncbi:unnamed protein product [marine sediment metagenome]|uniref:Uncharacterized protein n=1 Tax=marine sediment metagenome TaxID=412755 RepID=X1HZ69_9ZZZZ
MKTVTETLKRERMCKNSVLFKAAGPKVVTGLYLMKGAYESLGGPSEIEITVKGKK